MLFDDLHFCVLGMDHTPEEIVSGFNTKMPHAILIPLPYHGHINPMLQLAWKLASDGFFITFVNTDINHHRIIKANACNRFMHHHNIRMISVPDGLPTEDTRRDIPRVLETLQQSMGPSVIHKLIQENNENEQQHKVSCIIGDVLNCFGLKQVAEHFGIPLAVFHPSLVSTCAIRHFCSRLVSLGILSPQGTSKTDQRAKYLPSMPALYPDELPWLHGGEYLFQLGIRSGQEIGQIKWVLFNSIYELEAPVVDELSKEVGAYPIGPLIPPEFLEEESAATTKALPSFWADEDECLEWLDKQCAQSVIYVSFGTLAVWSERQVEEFAAGLEATKRPFLWVVRSDLVEGSKTVLPLGFLESIRDRGCIVRWAPQLRVLSHPSIACFVTHCGWNSVQESITMGVPMLCSPYFSDQSINKAYVVDVWKAGLALNKNKDGIIEKGEFTKGVERLLVEAEGLEIRKEVNRLKSIVRNAVKEGGSSLTKYKSFVFDMKKQFIG